MLKVLPFRQSVGYCGPASLKMVLGFYGVQKSELALARLCHTTRAAGTTAANIVAAAEQLGFTGTIIDHASIDDLYSWVVVKKVPVIVAWFSTDDGHYSVVVHIDKTHVYLQDPEIGKRRRIDRKTFERIWFDFRGDVMMAESDVILRRMIVIQKKAKP